VRVQVDKGQASAASGVLAVACIGLLVGFPKWPAWVIGALALGALGGLYMCFAYVFGWWPIGSKATPSVSIDMPKPESLVKQTERARGTAKYVPGDETLWLIVETGGDFYPQAKIHARRAGTWEQPVLFGRIGRDIGQGYTLHAVGAEAAANTRFELFLQQEAARRNNPALTEATGTFPRVSTYASVHVTRGVE
jgi:hypothetical protein